MTDPVAKARAFASRAHAGQTRKGPSAQPYIAHPEEVATLVAEFGGDSVAIAAAWLHDTVEDCAPTLADIEAEFGPDIAAVVAEVTDAPGLPSAERKRRQVAHAPHKSRAAALIKLADKISNVRSIARTPPDWTDARKRAYLDWAEAVVAALPALPQTGIARFEATLADARARL